MVFRTKGPSNKPMKSFFQPSIGMFLRMLCNKKDCVRWLWYDSFQGLMSRMKNVLGSLEFKIARVSSLLILVSPCFASLLERTVAQRLLWAPDRYFVMTPLKVHFRYIWPLGNELRIVGYFPKDWMRSSFKKNFLNFHLYRKGTHSGF